jgi:hypothetical protein
LRGSAKRIVLTALAFVVGVVLALPTLLSRKAEAGAPPRLEALAGTERLPAAADQDLARLPADDPENLCRGASAGAGSPSRQVATTDPGTPLPTLSVSHTVAPRGRPEPVVYLAAAPVSAPWPDPHSIDRQRRYHLRP